MDSFYWHWVLEGFGKNKTRIASNKSEDVFVLLLLNRLDARSRQDESIRNIVYNESSPYFSNIWRKLFYSQMFVDN